MRPADWAPHAAIVLLLSPAIASPAFAQTPPPPTSGPAAPAPVTAAPAGEKAPHEHVVNSPPRAVDKGTAPQEKDSSQLLDALQELRSAVKNIDGNINQIDQLLLQGDVGNSERLVYIIANIVSVFLFFVIAVLAVWMLLTQRRIVALLRNPGDGSAISMDMLKILQSVDAQLIENSRVIAQHEQDARGREGEERERQARRGQEAPEREAEAAPGDGGPASIAEETPRAGDPVADAPPPSKPDADEIKGLFEAFGLDAEDPETFTWKVDDAAEDVVGQRLAQVVERANQRAGTTNTAMRNRVGAWFDEHYEGRYQAIRDEPGSQRLVDRHEIQGPTPDPFLNRITELLAIGLRDTYARRVLLKAKVTAR